MPNSKGRRATGRTDSAFSFGATSNPNVFCFKAVSPSSTLISDARVPAPLGTSGTVVVNMSKSRECRGTSCMPRVADILQQTLVQERKDLQFSDLTVSVEGTDFHCHCLILAAISGFFRSLLSSGMKEAVEKKVRLQDVSCVAFTEIMRWIYDGDLILTFDNVFELFPAVDQLDIAPLKEACLEFLTDNLSHKNCVSIYEMSCMYNCEDLRKRSWDYLLHNFDSVCSSQEICKLDTKDMMNLISDSELVTQSEDKVVESVLKWVGYETNDSHCLGHATMSEKGRGHPHELIIDTKAFHNDGSPENDREEQLKGMPDEAITENMAEGKDRGKEELAETNQDKKTDGKLPSDTNKVEIKSRSRIESLGNLLEATRYLLVSSNCLWIYLANDARVQADQKCRDVQDRILHHKTQLDKHQDEWRYAETHRASDQLKDVAMAQSNSRLWCKLNWNTAWKTVQLNVDFDSTTHIAYYDNNIYFRKSGKYLYVLMPGYNTYHCIIDARNNTDIFGNCIRDSNGNIETVAMFPVGNELISIYTVTGQDIYHVESACLNLTKLSQWTPAGQLFTSGMEVAAITNIGQRIVVFWKKGGQSYINVECFDLSQGKSFLLPDQLSSADGLVTFKHGDQAFALQQNGALWSIREQKEAPYITLKLEMWLWNFQRAVNGALLVCGELWVFEPQQEGTNVQEEGVTAKLEGVFHQVRFCHGTSKTGFIHAVLPKSAT